MMLRETSNETEMITHSLDKLFHSHFHTLPYSENLPIMLQIAFHLFFWLYRQIRRGGGSGSENCASVRSISFSGRPECPSHRSYHGGRPPSYSAAMFVFVIQTPISGGGSDTGAVSS